MTDATDAPPPAPEPRVYVHIEREKGDRYSVLSADLETIGSQLRGNRVSQFSIRSFLPVMVTFVRSR